MSRTDEQFMSSLGAELLRRTDTTSLNIYYLAISLHLSEKITGKSTPRSIIQFKAIVVFNPTATLFAKRIFSARKRVIVQTSVLVKRQRRCLRISLYFRIIV